MAEERNREEKIKAACDYALMASVSGLKFLSKDEKERRWFERCVKEECYGESCRKKMADAVDSDDPPKALGRAILAVAKDAKKAYMRYFKSRCVRRDGRIYSPILDAFWDPESKTWTWERDGWIGFTADYGLGDCR